MTNANKALKHGRYVGLRHAAKEHGLPHGSLSALCRQGKTVAQAVRRLKAERKRVAEEIQAMHAAVVENRGRPPLRPARPGPTRMLKTDGGRVVTHGEVMRGILKCEGIDRPVEDGRRPTTTICELCKAVVMVSARGVIPRVCLSCRAVRHAARPSATERSRRWGSAADARCRRKPGRSAQNNSGTDGRT